MEKTYREHGEQEAERPIQKFQSQHNLHTMAKKIIRLSAYKNPLKEDLEKLQVGEELTLKITAEELTKVSSRCSYLKKTRGWVYMVNTKENEATITCKEKPIEDSDHGNN